MMIFPKWLPRQALWRFSFSFALKEIFPKTFVVFPAKLLNLALRLRLGLMSLLLAT